MPLAYARVGEFNSLSLGFGEIVSHHSTSHVPYAEFHLLCYERSWRVVKDGKPVMSGVSLHSYTRIQKVLDTMGSAKFVSIRETSLLDLQITLEDGWRVDYFGFNTGDQLMHAFDEKAKTIASFRPRYGWQIEMEKPMSRSRHFMDPALRKSSDKE